MTTSHPPRPKVKLYPAHGSGFIAFYDPAEADRYMNSLEEALNFVTAPTIINATAVFLDRLPATTATTKVTGAPDATDVEGIIP